jgi:hypothetical protein
MLALRADGKSAKTLKTYRESVDQLIGFLASPPPLPEEVANLLDSAQPVTGPGDITATRLRAFMSHLQVLHKPATANNRYRGLQQWFRWMASEDEIEYSPFAKLSPPAVPEEPVPVVPVEHIRAVLATCKAPGSGEDRGWAGSSAQYPLAGGASRARAAVSVDAVGGRADEDQAADRRGAGQGAPGDRRLQAARGGDRADRAGGRWAAVPARTGTMRHRRGGPAAARPGGRADRHCPHRRHRGSAWPARPWL